ncbi:hypothetical protein BUTYVIB_01179 [Eshraghiella crossota DSM 2876]|uniref:Uncharacterized protein n=1 Tax=Eshraghiella crossota DSM 2876 TaxID=511680 RepID=D4RZB3_9FIRM|nr:hypothetical protein BUTYVIB_01179 [Butyrivibrio crossotus DSM 2876]
MNNSLMNLISLYHISKIYQLDLQIFLQFFTGYLPCFAPFFIVILYKFNKLNF